MPAEKILIVEDEQSVVQLMKSNLEKLGYEIADAVSTGEEAVAAAGKFRPDIVLMDIELQGGMDGIETAKQIRLEFGIPAIFVSAHQSDYTLERTHVAEPLGFIPKPFSAKSLQGAIETGLRSHQAIKSRIQEAIQVAERHYRTLFENMIDGVFHINSSGRLVLVNPSFARIMGYSSPEELLEFSPYVEKHFVSSERYGELLEALRRHQHVKGFEFQAYRKDGSIIWLAQNTRALSDSNQNEPYFEGIVQDISERKETENSLQALLARQAAILAAVPDIIMEVDEHRVYRWANKAGFEFFGDDVIGKEAAYYFEGDQDTYDSVRSIFQGDENLIYVESWQRRKDDQKRLLAWRCHALKDHSGKVIGALSSARDITDMKLVEEERLKALTRQVLLNQLQQDLLGTGELAHKLKLITDGIVDIFEADFCCIWLMGPGDLCERGCMHAAVREGPNACRHKDKCLRLIASSGRYTHTNGAAHQRIPFGAHKIGRIASGEEHVLFTNDVACDPGISDHDWVKRLGLVSFAGFQLHLSGGENCGVLALFSTRAISPEEKAQMDALSAAAAQVILGAQAEEALRQSEERFRLIAETIDEVFWISDVVEEKMLYISPAFERVWGHSRQKLYENRKAFRETLHPEDFERIIEAFYAQKKGQAYGHEYRIIRSDGSVRQIWDRGFPIRDENGRSRIYVGVAQDVTDWKNAEKALKKSTEYLNQIINCIGDPVFVKDRQHRFVISNDANCDLVGMKREEVIGKALDDSMPKDVIDLIFEQEDRVFKTGVADITIEELEVRTGRRYTVMTNKTLLTDADGNQQIVGVVRDITDIKKAENERTKLEMQLRQAQKLEAIGQLAAGIAHEINTPTQYVGDNTRFLMDAFDDLIKGLKNYNRLLKANREGNVDSKLLEEIEAAVAAADLDYLTEEIPKAISQSLEGLDRIATIVRAMKEFSHPGGEEKQVIDLNHAIQNTLTVCRNEWKYVAEVVLDFDATLPSVSCLPGDINQVILNLVVNAAHAISEATNGGEQGKGTIGVSTRHDGNWAEIRISDTGAGIPEKNRSKIFTPFFTTKEVGKGTGQGLAISHSVIVGKHSGTLEFETEAGKGTTFIIRLPLSNSTSNSESGTKSVQ